MNSYKISNNNLYHYCLRILVVLLVCSSCASKKQRVTFDDITQPKREFRGAWFSTAWQSRYRNMSSGQMKTYFIASLDKLQACGINAVIFQIRPQADAFYKSELEPWSAHLTGKQGKAPDGNFDPLAFLVEECHKRNMELHAWLNPYRVTTSEKDELAPNSLYYREPYRFVKYGGKIYFDPGMPQNRKFICMVVKDIVSRYDVDAVHMDDYFYPYPIAGKSFPDDASFQEYGRSRGYNDNSRADWRRNNVNQLIEEVKFAIASVKPWVRFGISPFGIYRNKKNTPDGSGSNTNGLQNYDDLYADVKLWVDKGWIDYCMPQIYWEIGHKAADFKTLIEWWADNCDNRPLYIGQDVKRTMDAATPSGDTQLQQKMILSRSFPAIKGNCFWPAYEILDNYKTIADELRSDYQRYPALIPAYTHMFDKRPKTVDKLKTEYTETCHILKWKSNADANDPETARYYVIYRFTKGEKENLDDAKHIVGITRQTEYVLPYEGAKNEYKYFVTAVDAFHNESKGKQIKVKL